MDNTNTNMFDKFQTVESLAPVIAGDRKARAELVRTFEALVWTVVNDVQVRSAARTREDMYMDLWHHVFRNDCKLIRSFDGRAKFSTYLVTCLTRRALDIAEGEATRRRHRGGLAEENTIDRDDRVRALRPDVGVEVDGYERREEISWQRRVVSEALEQLKPVKRRFFRAAFEDKLCTEDLMEMFGLSSTAVFQWKHRIKARLRGIIGGMQPPAAAAQIQ